MRVRSLRSPWTSWAVGLVAGSTLALTQWPLAAEQTTDAGAAAPALAGRPCRVHGVVLSGTTPLPGATITAKVGERVVGATSSDVDGSYVLALAPGTYQLHAQLTAFSTTDREVTVGTPPCEASSDMSLVLATRVPGAAPLPPPSPVQAGRGGVNGAFPGGPGGPGGFGGRGRGGPGRFEALSVQQAPGADAAAVVDLAPAASASDPASSLLPAGFSLDAPLESVAVSGTMVEVDRAIMTDRLQALARGDFNLADGQVAAGAGQPTLGVGGDLFGAGGRGGAGGPGGPGGLGGRVGGANRTQANASYNFGGSPFDAAPYALRGEATKRQYFQQSTSITLGGPLNIPHVYQGATRTTYNFSYTASRNSDLFDQFATVPSDNWRTGNFSDSATPIVDPLTGKPFPGNVIPSSRISATARALLNYIPQSTLPGDTRNFRYTTTQRSNTDAFTFRITHSLTNPQNGRGGRGGAGFGPAGRGATTASGSSTQTSTQAGTSGRGTPGQTATQGSTPGTGQAGAAGQTQTNGRAGTGTNPGATPTANAGRQGGGPGGQGRGGRGNFQPPLAVTMNATINYRRNDGDRPNVYPLLNGTTKGNTLSVPVTVNVRNGRWMHAFTTTFNRTASTTLGSFAFVQDVTGSAGIAGVSSDPFDWGLPTLTFSTFTALRDVAPSRRVNKSWQLGYTASRTAGAHNFRFGVTYQQQANDSRSDSNARGSYTFTGLYTAGGLSTTRGGGQDFADFLLGLPQQASRQYSVSTDNISSPIAIRGRQVSAYIQDDWRWKARWTINWGLQYDYVAPYTEANGHLVNLDAAPDFSAVAPVLAGGIGPYSGSFGNGLVNPDRNNVGPRVGAAWRATNRSVVRFGYGLTYNAGSYQSIAQQLEQQPPFFLTGTSIGSLASPLTLSDPFATISASTVTNSYGIDKNYVLGLIHQWTADYSRDLFRSWNVGATYIGTRGSNLDMLRAPNRGPSGLRIANVQSFTWQSSEGSSRMHGIALRAQKRQTKGVSGSVSYTLSKSEDDTTATGGNATVAQDDQNLAAEWALSNFDRRHQLTGTMSVELPFGRNRRWLDTGGYLAAALGGWSMSASLTWQSGTPLTVRCSTCASDVARGVGGTLRADYNGQPIALANPTVDAYFNTSAFSIPQAGTFGNSGRNIVVGPGSRLLNAVFTRDIVVGGRTLSVNVNANNLLNLVNYASVDTNVNSVTFGQIQSVRGMRTVRVSLRMRF